MKMQLKWLKEIIIVCWMRADVEIFFMSMISAQTMEYKMIQSGIFAY